VASRGTLRRIRAGSGSDAGGDKAPGTRARLCGLVCAVTVESRNELRRNGLAKKIAIRIVSPLTQRVDARLNRLERDLRSGIDGIAERLITLRRSVDRIEVRLQEIERLLEKTDHGS
jgi:hypothetical protein